MIERLAHFFDRIERDRPGLFRAATSGWMLLAMALVLAAAYALTH
jgi:hypothetical protein